MVNSNLVAKVALASAAVAAISSQSASAANRWWDGGTGNWSTVADWSTVSGATTPDPAAVPGINDDLFFNITTANAAAATVSNGGSARSARSLTFNTSGASNIRAGGSGAANSLLTIGAGGLTINSGAGTVTLGQTPASFGTLSVALGAAQAWTNDSSNTHTYAGTLSNAGFNLAVDGTGNTTFSGVISGAGGLTKNGNGTLRLNAANTFNGALQVNSGSLLIGNYTGIDNVSGITVAGGTIDFLVVGTGATSDTNTKAVSLNGTFKTGGGGGGNTVALTHSGTITLTGDSLVWAHGNATINLSNTVSLGANTLTFQTDGALSGNQISGQITGAGGLTKTAGNTLTLTNTNTYLGTTTVSAGKLLINGDNSGATGAVNVNGTSVLGGTGTIGGAVTVAATAKISPGTSIESLDVASASIDGTLVAEYDATGSGSADLLAVAGLLTLNPTTSVLDLDALGGPADDGAYVIATYGTLSGTFGSVLDLPLGYSVDYNYGGTNNTIAVVIPEPATLGLLASAGLMLGRRRRVIA